MFEDQLASDAVGIAEPEVGHDLVAGNDPVLRIERHVAVVEISHLIAVGTDWRARQADHRMGEAAATPHGLAPDIALTRFLVICAVMGFIEDERQP